MSTHISLPRTSRPDVVSYWCCQVTSAWSMNWRLCPSQMARSIGESRSSGSCPAASMSELINSRTVIRSSSSEVTSQVFAWSGRLARSGRGQPTPAKTPSMIGWGRAPVSRLGEPAAARSRPLVEELQELGGCQACLPQDRRQRAPLHDAMLWDDGHPPVLIPVYRVAPLGPHIRKADRLQRTDDLPHRQVG